MKTHQDVLQDIAPETRAALQTKSDVAGLKHAISYFGALFLTSTWIYLGMPFWWAVLVIQGVLLMFLFKLQHECTHETPFAAKWISKLAGHFVGLVLIQPFNAFRYFHLAHHRYTNDPERDPELLSGAKPETWGALSWYVSGIPYWIGGVSLVLRNAIAPKSHSYLPERAKGRLRREARWMGLVYLCIGVSFYWSNIMLWLWIVPALIGAPALRLYLLAEHGRCPFVANMLENTRTTYANRLVRWLAWNMPYHIEHHSAPNVPFHKLPELHTHMQSELRSTSKGYISFTKGYAANLK
jgi:fatty acid desaturase